MRPNSAHRCAPPARTGAAEQHGEDGAGARRLCSRDVGRVREFLRLPEGEPTRRTRGSTSRSSRAMPAARSGARGLLRVAATASLGIADIRMMMDDGPSARSSTQHAPPRQDRTGSNRKRPISRGPRLTGIGGGGGGS